MRALVFSLGLLLVSCGSDEETTPEDSSSRDETPGEAADNAADAEDTRRPDNSERASSPSQARDEARALVARQLQKREQEQRASEELFFLFDVAREGRYIVRVFHREGDDLRQVAGRFHAVADSVETGRGDERWRLVWRRSIGREELVLRRNDAAGTELILPFRKLVRVPAPAPRSR